MEEVYIVNHITFEDKEYYLFGAITLEYGDVTTTRLVINPRVLWGGSDLKINNEIFDKLMIE